MSDTVTDQRDRTHRVASTRPQHVVALQGANEIRLARAEQKRRLAMARDTHAARAIAAGLVADTPRELVTLTVSDLLLSCRRLGERGASRILVLAGLHGGERLGDGTPRYGTLTPRQRSVLAAALRGDDDVSAIAPVLEAA